MDELEQSVSYNPSPESYTLIDGEDPFRPTKEKYSAKDLKFLKAIVEHKENGSPKLCKFLFRMRHFQVEFRTSR